MTTLYDKLMTKSDAIPSVTTAAYDFGENTALTGDFVLAFARARLNQIEGGLTRLLNRMKLAEAEADAIGQAIAFFSSRSQGWDGTGKATDQIHRDAENFIYDLAQKLPEGSRVRKELMFLATDDKSPMRTNGAGGADTIVTPDEVSGILQNLQTLQKSIDRSSSEDQLLVNKGMGDHNTVLQLAASMIQGFNETAKAILGRS